MNALKLFATSLAFLLALGLMTQVQAQEREQRRPALLPPGIDRLDLAGEQKDKIAKLEKEFQSKLEAAKKKLDEAIEQAKQNQDRQKAQEASEAFRKELAQLQE